MAQATGFSLSVPPGFRGLEAADVAQLAIAGGRDAEAALEGAGEVERAVEAAIGGDFGDRLVAEVRREACWSRVSSNQAFGARPVWVLNRRLK